MINSKTNNSRWLRIAFAAVGVLVVGAMILAALNSCAAPGQASSVSPTVVSPTAVAQTSVPTSVPKTSVAPTAVAPTSVPTAVPTAISNPTVPIDPTTLTAQVNGDSVAIPLADVKSKINTRFAVTTPQGSASYMAYVWNGTISVRADICPPCGSKSFKLTKGTLVCNSCGTVFDAVNGQGKSGACVRYPKESVAFQISGDSIVMKMSDLSTSYQKTLAID